MTKNKTGIEKAFELLLFAQNKFKEAEMFIEWISPIGDVYYDKPEAIMQIKLEQNWR